jgi:hypothetical protein
MGLDAHGRPRHSMTEKGRPCTAMLRVSLVGSSAWEWAKNSQPPRISGNRGWSRSWRTGDQPQCGTLTPGPRRRTIPGIRPSPVPRGDSSLPSARRCRPRLMPSTGRPSAASWGSSRHQPEALSWAQAGIQRPRARQDDGPGRAAWSGRRPGRTEAQPGAWRPPG